MSQKEIYNKREASHPYMHASHPYIHAACQAFLVNVITLRAEVSSRRPCGSAAGRKTGVEDRGTRECILVTPSLAAVLLLANLSHGHRGGAVPLSKLERLVGGRPHAWGNAHRLGYISFRDMCIARKSMYCKCLYRTWRELWHGGACLSSPVLHMSFMQNERILAFCDA